MMPHNKTEKVLSPVHPNIGIEIAYRRLLSKAINAMHTSILAWICAAWREETAPRFAKDNIVSGLVELFRRLAGQWLARFDVLANELAAYFAQSVAQRADGTLKNILKKGGMAVEWHPSPAQRQIMDATIAQNVALIKSIPQAYLSRVEVLVLQSVQTGREMHGLYKGLRQIQTEIGQEGAKAKRRAALIAKDQNNKATAALVNARQAEVGIKEAVWLHSGGGREPRPSHVKAGRDKVRYDLAKGWFDPAEKKWILPGTLINCRCVSKPILRGFS
jgi:hypothetical protein